MGAILLLCLVPSRYFLRRSIAPQMAERLRPRQTRVKTGCLVCRLRRKKCDERKPICTGCQRNCLICSWAGGQLESRGSAESGWRSRLESGVRVSQATTDLALAVGQTALEQSREPTSKLLQESINLGRLSSLPLSPRFPESFSTSPLKNPSSKILFEHYVSETSHLLSSIRGPDNPFIRCVLPFAQVDSMVMDSVLALSGAHLCSTSSNPDVQLASTTRYALVLRQFKHTLTQLTLGKVSKPVNLLLTALMLCQIEVGLINHLDSSVHADRSHSPSEATPTEQYSIISALAPHSSTLFFLIPPRLTMNSPAFSWSSTPTSYPLSTSPPISTPTTTP